MYLVWRKGSCSVPCHYHLQTEELLIKRRSLLEKKIAQELDKAKTYTKAQNKKGVLTERTNALSLPLRISIVYPSPRDFDRPGLGL